MQSIFQSIFKQNFLWNPLSSICEEEMKNLCDRKSFSLVWPGNETILSLDCMVTLYKNSKHRSATETSCFIYDLPFAISSFNTVIWRLNKPHLQIRTWLVGGNIKQSKRRFKKVSTCFLCVTLHFGNSVFTTLQNKEGLRTLRVCFFFSLIITK